MTLAPSSKLEFLLATSCIKLILRFLELGSKAACVVVSAHRGLYTHQLIDTFLQLTVLASCRFQHRGTVSQLFIAFPEFGPEVFCFTLQAIEHSRELFADSLEVAFPLSEFLVVLFQQLDPLGALLFFKEPGEVLTARHYKYSHERLFCRK